jgi:hypothetical protein
VATPVLPRGERRIEIYVCVIAYHCLVLANLIGVDLFDSMLTKMIEVEQRPTWKERNHG